MWNKSVKLPLTASQTEDEDGFVTGSKTFLEGIPANFRDVVRDEQILANQRGYTADQTIEIAECNYNGQKHLLDEENGDQYEVKRAFHADKSMNISLVCERRERGGTI